MKHPRCAGIIVFNGNQTILVSAKPTKFSFPKGKKNKGETDLDGAWRELQEETGLTQKDVKLIHPDTTYLDEMNKKHKPHIRYFIGYLTISNPPKLTYDKKEIKNIAWYHIDNALDIDKLRKSRKDILERAYWIYTGNKNK